MKTCVLLAGLVPSLIIGFCCVSCDRIDGAWDKLTNKDDSEAKIPGMAITMTELEQSDKAYEKYLSHWEKLPGLLIKVRDEKSAFAIRNQIDQLAKDLPLVKTGLVEITDKADLKRVIVHNKNLSKRSEGKKRVEEIDASVYWYVKAENEDDYEKRMLRMANAVIYQLGRISKKTQETPVVEDVIHSGILGMIQVDINDREQAESNGKIKPMPKDWLPPGVTRQ